jgi:endonuclease/exonuclease/phosphatase family metal-dependent hydrolase
MTTDTLGYAQMTKHFTDVNKVTANYNGITYHGYDESNEECRLIDYCFINENVKGKSYRVLNKTFDGKYPSDHFGLKIELDI